MTIPPGYSLSGTRPARVSTSMIRLRLTAMSSLTSDLHARERCEGACGAEPAAQEGTRKHQGSFGRSKVPVTALSKVALTAAGLFVIWGAGCSGSSVAGDGAGNDSGGSPGGSGGGTAGGGTGASSGSTATGGGGGLDGSGLTGGNDGGTDADGGCEVTGCGHVPGKPFCAGAAGCVECSSGNADTCPPDRYCKTWSCKPGCKTSSDCFVSGGTSAVTCNGHKCVGCKGNADCKPGFYCSIDICLPS